ncbi:MAG: GTPase [Promethearchaeota archaeon]
MTKKRYSKYSKKKKFDPQKKQTQKKKKFGENQTFKSNKLNVEKQKLVVLGNSNVGKSTFVRFLIGNPKITIGIAGKHAGSTKTIKKYSFSNLPFDIIDLPGFGAMTTITKYEREKVHNSIINYIESNRQYIFLAVVIVNSIRINDELEKWYYQNKETIPLSFEFVSWLDELKIPCIVLINKIDKLKKSQISQIERKIRMIFEEFGFREKEIDCNSGLILIKSISLKKGINLQGLKELIFNKFKNWE